MSWREACFSLTVRMAINHTRGYHRRDRVLLCADILRYLKEADVACSVYECAYWYIIARFRVA